LARPQNSWVKTTRKQEEIGLKTVLAMMGDQSPKPPGILRLSAGGKLALGMAVGVVIGQAGAAEPSPYLPPAPGTALGLLPSRALSSAQAEGDYSRRGGLGHGVEAAHDLEGIVLGDIWSAVVKGHTPSFGLLVRSG